MKYYLAYGSNLNLTQMFHRCPHARVIGHTSLSDMRLVFRGSKTGSYLTVEPDEAASVPAGCSPFRMMTSWRSTTTKLPGVLPEANAARPGGHGCRHEGSRAAGHRRHDLHHAHRSPSGASLYVLLEGLQAGLP